MRQRGILLSCLVLSLSAGGAGAATPAASETRQPFLFAEDEMQLVVETAYGTLSRFTAATGKKVSFELKDFTTVYQRDFHQSRWLDLADMPEGPVIDVVRHVRSLDIAGIRSAYVVYRAGWNDHKAEWAATPWGADLMRMNVAQVLAKVGPELPEASRVRAVTSYSVTATLEGRSRTYRGAFLWIPNGGRKMGDFIVVDNVVQGIEEAVRDPYTPLPEKGLRVASHGPRPVRPMRKDSSLCNSSDNFYTSVPKKTGTEEHSSGSHSSSASFQVECTCDLTCTAECSATILSSSCTETGNTGSACHKVGQNSNTSTTVAYNTGQTTPPACAAGFGCQVKSCSFCLCGISVSVTINGNTVTFSKDSTAWDLSLSFPITCPACTLQPTPPPPTGGGGPAGGECAVDELVTPEQCVADCGGVVDGDYCDV